MREPVFFRITPDEAVGAFAVHRGSLKTRLDVQNAIYVRKPHQTAIVNIALKNLISEEPCYGTSAAAIVRNSEHQPKYIRITDFDDNGIEKDHIFMTAESYSETHLLAPDDILFARTGGTVGKTYFYDGSIGPAVFAGYCIRFRFDKTKVLPRYVYWYTKTKRYADWVRGIQRPAGQPNINRSEFLSLQLPLPSPAVQAKLSATLDAAFEKREEKLREAEDMLKGANTYISERLEICPETSPPKLCFAVGLSAIKADHTLSVKYYHPERLSAIRALRERQNLKVKRLHELVEFKRLTVQCEETDANFLGLAGVESHTGEFTGQQENASGQAYLYEKGDVLFSRLRPYLNKVVCAKTAGICSTEFCVMRICDRTEILPEFLADVLRSDLILSQTKHMMTGNTHPRISFEDIWNLYIPLPDLSDQREISECLAMRLETATHLKQQAEEDWETAKVQFEKSLLGE